MSDGLSALFWGVITFSILVLIHEGGHFLAARVFGVKVHEFMIGLPGPAIRIRGKRTTYGVTAVPLGGYVRIAGMEPGPEDPLLASALASVTRRRSASTFDVASDLAIDESSAEKLLATLVDWGALSADAGEDHTYHSRFNEAEALHPDILLDRARAVTYRALSTPKRIILLSMGVALNLLTAIAVFTFTLSVFGYMKDTGAIAQIAPDSAAERAGLRPGDRIVSVASVRTPDFNSLVSAVARFEPGDSVVLTIERSGSTLRVKAVLGQNPKTGRALLGVTPEVVPVKPSILEALGLSISYIAMTFAAIAGFFSPETFQASVSQSSSVIGAAYYAAEAARSGPLDYAGIVAVLSLSLGVINILPIPPLDGGKVALELIERLRGRPLPRNFSLGLSLSGAVLLFALIGYLMVQDVGRLIGG